MCSKFPLLYFFLILLLLFGENASAQDSMPVFKDAVKNRREKFYNSIVSQTILRNFSLPLNDENEDAWISALNAVNLVKFTNPVVLLKIDTAAKKAAGRSAEFKKALISLVNSDFPQKYRAQIFAIFKSPGNDSKVLAMAANYILPTATSAEMKAMQLYVQQRLQKQKKDAVLTELKFQLDGITKKISMPSIQSFFNPGYLPQTVLVFSFQRNDRNYPGLAIVRKADGSFLKVNDSVYFSVGQLARSESNMPGYISLGNTPQGIFRMDGFDTSKSFFIGPVTNIQLTMPFEFKASHFYRDSTLTDSVWTLAQYKNLLPDNLKNYRPLFGTYYAGSAGRNEIIAHGSTIDHTFYRNKKYAPYTPTEGCLVTAEYWNEESGRLENSDQLRLTRAVAAAGGANGYLVVIELDDKKEAVTIRDILPYLSK